MMAMNSITISPVHSEVPQTNTWMTCGWAEDEIDEGWSPASTFDSCSPPGDEYLCQMVRSHKYPQKVLKSDLKERKVQIKTFIELIDHWLLRYQSPKTNLNYIQMADTSHFSSTDLRISFCNKNVIKLCHLSSTCPHVCRTTTAIRRSEYKFLSHCVV